MTDIIKTSYTDMELKAYDSTFNPDDLKIDTIWWIIIPIISFLIILGSIMKQFTVGIFIGFIPVAIIFSIQLYYWYELTNTRKELTVNMNLEKKQRKEEKKEKEEMEANAVCIKDNNCKNDSICNSYGPELQQYTCKCTPDWTGKNCDELKAGANSDKRCQKDNGEDIPNIEYCNSRDVEDIKWQNKKLINPVDCKGDKLCHCVDTNTYDINCPYTRDGDINDLYNPYGCDVLNHEVFCPKSAEDDKAKCVIRSDTELGEDCAESTIGQSELCHGIYGKHNSYWDGDKFKCIVDCSDNKVYNKYKDKCEPFNYCKNKTDETECNRQPYCEFVNEKCKMNNTKHCVSMNENKCEEEDRCKWTKEENNHHKTCSDAMIVIDPIVDPGIPSIPDIIVPPLESNRQRIDGRIKTKGIKTNEGFVVGGLYEF